MGRGQRAQVGDRQVNKNGYEYVKTKDGWKGSHILVMEKHLGRPLLPGEYVAFLNGHRPPVTLDMIELRKRGDRKSKAARLAAIDARIEELQAERQALLEEDDG
jgi:hypothetical protein